MSFSVVMDTLRELNMLSITLRLLLAVIISGVIGLERGSNKHQAGLRTHILVCLGATLSMLTNQFICETMSSASDPARLGAQVISGIGFLGAGLILVTSRNKVKGLTTAAGLWASACVGIALGIGFYEGAIIAAALEFIVLAMLPKMENYFYDRSRVLDLFVELESLDDLKSFLVYIRNAANMVLETHVSKSGSITPNGYGLTVSLRMDKDTNHDQLIDELNQRPGVYMVEEF